MKLICMIFLVMVMANFGVLMTVKQLCRDREGTSEEDALVMKEHRVPETRAQKCFFDCVYQQGGFSDGKRFLKDGFLRKKSKYNTDENAQKVVEELANRCDGLQNEDRCELAAEIDACLFDRK